LGLRGSYAPSPNSADLDGGPDCVGGGLSALGVRSFLGHAARWRALLRREYALIYRAGLLDKKGPFEVMLRDKLNNFAHLLSKAGNSEEIFRQ
jgi:hypothetical protein